MEKLIFESENGESIEFTVEAQIRMGGRNYLLVSEETEDEEEAVCRIFADLSEENDENALYEEVEDDGLIDTLLPLFEEELDETAIEK